MIQIRYSGTFLRQAKKIGQTLQEDLVEATEQFKVRANHIRLRVHKLHGELDGFSSFSINYRYRVVFEWTGREQALFHAVGDHDIYE